MLQFSLREIASPQQHLDLISPAAAPEGESQREAPEPGSFARSTQGQLCRDAWRPAHTPPWPQSPCLGHTVRSEEQSHTLSHSFRLNNNLSFLPSWAGCLVMNVDREDNKELGH